MAQKCVPCTGGNNADAQCPILHDYRPFTDYAPRCAQVYKQTQNNAFASSYEMRSYLTQNAEELIKKNALEAYMNMQCKCVTPWDIGTMLPELNKQQCNDRICTFSVNDKYGLGLGRQYYEPEKEKEFRQKFVAEKEKEQAFFKESGACCGPANDMRYYPVDGIAENNYARYSVPSGGTQLS
jgi:hypothetical protein